MLFIHGRVTLLPLISVGRTLFRAEQRQAYYGILPVTNQLAPVNFFGKERSRLWRPTSRYMDALEPNWRYPNNSGKNIEFVVEIAHIIYLYFIFYGEYFMIKQVGLIAEAVNGRLTESGDCSNVAAGEFKKNSWHRSFTICRCSSGSKNEANTGFVSAPSAPEVTRYCTSEAPQFAAAQNKKRHNSLLRQGTSSEAPQFAAASKAPVQAPQFATLPQKHHNSLHARGTSWKRHNLLLHQRHQFRSATIQCCTRSTSLQV